MFPFNEIEKCRLRALECVRLNERRLPDIFRGPEIHNPKLGTSRKVLTYVVGKTHCCFSFQSFPQFPTADCATPLPFDEPDFERKLKALEQIYKKKAIEYKMHITQP